MNLQKAAKRDREIKKRKQGIVTDSKSVFSIVEIQKKRAKQIRQERKKKQERIEGGV